MRDIETQPTRVSSRPDAHRCRNRARVCPVRPPETATSGGFMKQPAQDLSQRGPATSEPRRSRARTKRAARASRLGRARPVPVPAPRLPPRRGSIRQSDSPAKRTLRSVQRDPAGRPVAANPSAGRGHYHAGVASSSCVMPFVPVAFSNYDFATLYASSCIVRVAGLRRSPDDSSADLTRDPRDSLRGKSHESHRDHRHGRPGSPEDPRGPHSPSPGATRCA